MGRPSMATTRRPQIVEAAQRVITRRGIAGTTMARIAEEAGVQTSLVSHYFGSKHAVLVATVEHAIDGYETMLEEALTSARPEDHLEELLEVCFGGHLLHRLYGTLVDEIRAAANFDHDIQVALRSLSEVFHQTWLEAILDAHADIDPTAAAKVAYGIVCLFQTAEALERQGFNRHRIRDARELARTLLSTLEQDPAAAPAPTGGDGSDGDPTPA